MYVCEMEDKKIDIDQIRIKPALFGSALVLLTAICLHYRGTTDKIDKLTASVEALTVMVSGHDKDIDAGKTTLLAFAGDVKTIRAQVDSIRAILPKPPTSKRYKK